MFIQWVAKSCGNKYFSPINAIRRFASRERVCLPRSACMAPESATLPCNGPPVVQSSEYVSMYFFVVFSCQSRGSELFRCCTFPNGFAIKNRQRHHPCWLRQAKRGAAAISQNDRRRRRRFFLLGERGKNTAQPHLRKLQLFTTSCARGQSTAKRQ